MDFLLSEEENTWEGQHTPKSLWDKGKPGPNVRVNQVVPHPL